MMTAVNAIIDPDLDFASYYQDGGDPDRDCERLYVWHHALWGRAVPGVGPFELEVVYDRGYGMRLRAADGNEFWLGSDGMIPTWSTPGWTNRFAPDLVAEIARDADDFYRIASAIGGYMVTDLHHFLDLPADTPGPARRLRTTGVPDPRPQRRRRPAGHQRRPGRADRVRGRRRQSRVQPAPPTAARLRIRPAQQRGSGPVTASASPSQTATRSRIWPTYHDSHDADGRHSGPANS